MNPEPVAPVPEPEQAPIPVPSFTVMTTPTPTNKPNFLILFIVVVLLMVGAFSVYLIINKGNTGNVATSNKGQNSLETKITAAPTVSPTIPVIDSSDTQLDKDIQEVNNKLSSLNTDVNNVDKGLNDTPIDSGL